MGGSVHTVCLLSKRCLLFDLSLALRPYYFIGATGSRRSVSGQSGQAFSTARQHLSTGYLTLADRWHLSWACASCPFQVEAGFPASAILAEACHITNHVPGPQSSSFFLLCHSHQLQHPRERLTADPLRWCAGKSTKTITKLESERERGRGQTLIMARPWLDMLWKVTVDESSIIYSSAELGYLFFQQHEQREIMA